MLNTDQRGYAANWGIYNSYKNGSEQEIYIRYQEFQEEEFKLNLFKNSNLHLELEWVMMTPTLNP